jgi:hypothetical protein
MQGLGTPAPVAPTQHLVVTGLYRYVRNPMYVAVLSLIFGQGLLFGSVGVLEYGILIWLAFFLFVFLYDPKNPFFTGREKVLGEISAALKGTGSAALSGMGGVGKTQTASHYAHIHRGEYKPRKPLCMDPMSSQVTQLRNQRASLTCPSG